MMLEVRGVSHLTRRVGTRKLVINTLFLDVGGVIQMC